MSSEHVREMVFGLVLYQLAQVCTIKNSTLQAMIDCIFVVVNCGPLDHPTNGIVTYSDTTYSSVAMYSCSSSYNISGNVTRICLGSGHWSGSEPTCRGILIQMRL